MTTHALAFDTVLFDVDGTLIDSNDAHTKAWTRALRDFGFFIEAKDVRQLIGMGADTLLARLAHIDEHSPLARAITRRKKTIFATLLPSLQATCGAKVLLEYLTTQGTHVAIARSGEDRERTALLRHAGVDHLISTGASEPDVEQSKLDPDVIAAALHQANARPEFTVMVGDTPYDVEAARRIGVQSIALRSGGFWSDTDLSNAVHIFDDPLGLLKYWQRAG